MLNLRSVLATCAVSAAMTGLTAVASHRAATLEPATGITATERPLDLPWWKRSLAHTVQEEWLFAQFMDSQHGPRWRTALPDKAVARMYQHWLQGRQGDGNP